MDFNAFKFKYSIQIVIIRSSKRVTEKIVRNQNVFTQIVKTFLSIEKKRQCTINREILFSYAKKLISQHKARQSIISINLNQKLLKKFNLLNTIKNNG
ncbi:MAG: hypothetical protein BGO77_02260 [Caedibacter sp. 37-49]|nr:MAG: hypothetical protein BGO77_02260 [Caedibacter sp. 37-49]